MIAAKRELRFGVGLLLFIQLLLAFASIGLLTRMPPAIDRILHENVASIEAAEEMLGVLALVGRGGASPGELDARFFAALARAGGSVSEGDEPAILERVERGYERLRQDAPGSFAETVNAVGELVRLNREAMRRTRDQASRLSEAGAWAAVMMALAAFGAGLLVMVRIQKRVVEPLDEIHSVVRSEKAGDPYRRCQLRDAPPELREIMITLNELLDYRYPTREPPAKG